MVIFTNECNYWYTHHVLLNSSNSVYAQHGIPRPLSTKHLRALRIILVSWFLVHLNPFQPVPIPKITCIICIFFRTNNFYYLTFVHENALFSTHRTYPPGRLKWPLRQQSKDTLSIVCYSCSVFAAHHHAPFNMNSKALNLVLLAASALTINCALSLSLLKRINRQQSHTHRRRLAYHQPLDG